MAADVYRPAAVEQLQILGEKLGVPVFHERGLAPPEMCRRALEAAQRDRQHVVIFDTAGRLAIDDELMVELEEIKREVAPENILLVADAMIGQDAVKTAAEFDRRLSIDGFILTKLDGDARGGAALSIKEVTGKPIKFLGMGESLDRLEEFRPEGLASRILGLRRHRRAGQGLRAGRRRGDGRGRGAEDPLAATSRSRTSSTRSGWSGRWGPSAS